MQPLLLNMSPLLPLNNLVRNGSDSGTQQLSLQYFPALVSCGQAEPDYVAESAPATPYLCGVHYSI